MFSVFAILLICLVRSDSNSADLNISVSCSMIVPTKGVGLQMRFIRYLVHSKVDFTQSPVDFVARPVTDPFMSSLPEVLSTTGTLSPRAPSTGSRDSSTVVLKTSLD